ncbi:MAG TPA: hypothetical protein PK992_04650 [Planctomycetaceae bacterium]|nr:hypothetical protein [Planctomycetaceae bacterium]
MVVVAEEEDVAAVDDPVAVVAFPLRRDLAAVAWAAQVQAGAVLEQVALEQEGAALAQAVLVLVLEAAVLALEQGAPVLEAPVLEAAAPGPEQVVWVELGVQELAAVAPGSG